MLGRISKSLEGAPRQKPDNVSTEGGQLTGSDLGAPAPPSEALQQLSKQVEEWQREREEHKRERRDDYKPEPPSGRPPLFHR